MDKNDIVVYKASIARKLLHLGHQIIDITPGKDRDGSVNFCKVIFIFHIDKTTAHGFFRTPLFHFHTVFCSLCATQSTQSVRYIIKKASITIQIRL